MVRALRALSLPLFLLVVLAERSAAAACAPGKMVLVTGGTGRTGAIASRLLLKQGYCLRLFTRNASKARAMFEGVPRWQLSAFEGELGDSRSVRAAFDANDVVAPSSPPSPPISHVLFAAGGEQADYDAVNNRGLSYCAAEAGKLRAHVVVISAAWVTRPFSIAAVLFNSLYDDPMALHLIGENTLRATPGLTYVVLRPGALVPDADFDASAGCGDGVRMAQGDNFGFLEAGMPGLAFTPLAKLLVTSLLSPTQARVTVSGLCASNGGRDGEWGRGERGGKCAAYESVPILWGCCVFVLGKGGRWDDHRLPL